MFTWSRCGGWVLGCTGGVHGPVCTGGVHGGGVHGGGVHALVCTLM